jgi:hypothetical protein
MPERNPMSDVFNEASTDSSVSFSPRTSVLQTRHEWWPHDSASRLPAPANRASIPQQHLRAAGTIGEWSLEISFRRLKLQKIFLEFAVDYFWFPKVPPAIWIRRAWDDATGKFDSG